MPALNEFFVVASEHSRLDAERVADEVAKAFDATQYQGRRVLVIVPDNTRSGPIDRVFKALFQAIGQSISKLDVLVALGTHQPMAESAICKRLGLSADERNGMYAKVGLYNHAWDDPGALQQVGTLDQTTVETLSDGRFSMSVPVQVNRRVFDYDEIVIIGPVFPHEVVGFSGGNKYLFPGISGPELLNFFHWLGALVTNPEIIGIANTPVRRVVDAAGAMVPVPKRCLCLVVKDGDLAGLACGTPESAWRAAWPLSESLHVQRTGRQFKTIVSCVPTMYEDVWTGGKGMYKLEPVLAPGGELIIFGPHIQQVSVTHGKTLLEVGYHCRDYFLGQWEQFKHHPWGVLAHSTHVRGSGTFANGVERCRAQVTLATGISREVCERINLGYRDPFTFNPAGYAGRESEGILLVPKAGEMLFRP